MNAVSELKCLKSRSNLYDFSKSSIETKQNTVYFDKFNNIFCKLLQQSVDVSSLHNISNIIFICRLQLNFVVNLWLL